MSDLQVMDDGCPVLALGPRDAARALGVGQRLLWTLTNRGEVPHVRLGRRVLYPLDLLREYLAEKAREGGQR
jgi:excisionase family DNA binding protein